jgi:PBSX family phage terminase large subunit
MSSLFRTVVAPRTAAVEDPATILRKMLSPKQREFVDDASRFKVARCGRRSGKTWMLAADAILTMLAEPNVPILYAGLTRDSAKKAIWDILLGMLEELGIHHEARVSELCIILPNKSNITLFGCDSQNARTRLRGRKFRKIYFDETGFFTNLDPLIHAVLPTLADFGGSLYLTSSPGVLLSGFFHDVDHGLKGEQWSRYHWTIHDNPFFQGSSKDTRYATRADEELAIICDLEFGGNRDSASFRREYLGQWISDDQVLVYPVSAGNLGDVKFTHAEHIVAADFSSNITSAIVVGRYSEFSRTFAIVDSVVSHDWDIDTYARHIERYILKYKAALCVGHLGGCTEDVTKQMRRRYQIPIRGVELKDKTFYQRIFANDLVSGYIKVRENLPVLTEFSKIVKDSNGNEIGGQQNCGANAALVAYHLVYQTHLQSFEPPLSDEERHIEQLERSANAEDEPWCDKW